MFFTSLHVVYKYKDVLHRNCDICQYPVPVMLTSTRSNAAKKMSKGFNLSLASSVNELNKLRPCFCYKTSSTGTSRQALVWSFEKRNHLEATDGVFWEASQRLSASVTRPHDPQALPEFLEFSYNDSSQKWVLMTPSLNARNNVSRKPQLVLCTTTHLWNGWRVVPKHSRVNFKLGGFKTAKTAVFVTSVLKRTTKVNLGSISNNIGTWRDIMRRMPGIICRFICKFNFTYYISSKCYIQ